MRKRYFKQNKILNLILTLCFVLNTFSSSALGAVGPLAPDYNLQLPLLRYLSINSANPFNYFNFLLDKGLSPQGTVPVSAREQEIQAISEKLMKEIIIPQLSFDVNHSSQYAPLRQIYYSLILAEYFKRKQAQGLSPQGADPKTKGTVPDPYEALINSGTTVGLESELPWSKDKIFQQYLSSYQKGEYQIKRSVLGLARMYFSGGIVAYPDVTNMAKMGNFNIISADSPLNKVYRPTPEQDNFIPMMKTNGQGDNPVAGGEIEVVGEKGITIAPVANKKEDEQTKTVIVPMEIWETTSDEMLNLIEGALNDMESRLTELAHFDPQYRRLHEEIHILLMRKESILKEGMPKFTSKKECLLWLMPADENNDVRKEDAAISAYLYLRTAKIRLFPGSLPAVTTKELSDKAASLVKEKLFPYEIEIDGTAFNVDASILDKLYEYLEELINRHITIMNEDGVELMTRYTEPEQISYFLWNAYQELKREKSLNLGTGTNFPIKINGGEQAKARSITANPQTEGAASPLKYELYYGFHYDKFSRAIFHAGYVEIGKMKDGPYIRNLHIPWEIRDFVEQELNEAQKKHGITGEVTIRGTGLTVDDIEGQALVLQIGRRPEDETIDIHKIGKEIMDKAVKKVEEVQAGSPVTAYELVTNLWPGDNVEYWGGIPRLISTHEDLEGITGFLKLPSGSYSDFLGRKIRDTLNVRLRKGNEYLKRLFRELLEKKILSSPTQYEEFRNILELPVQAIFDKVLEEHGLKTDAGIITYEDIIDYYGEGYYRGEEDREAIKEKFTNVLEEIEAGKSEKNTLLKNGATEPLLLVGLSEIIIHRLLQETGWSAFFGPLIEKARNPELKLKEYIEAELKARELLRNDGSIHPSIQNIVLSAVREGELDMEIVSPLADTEKPQQSASPLITGQGESRLDESINYNVTFGPGGESRFDESMKPLGGIDLNAIKLELKNYASSPLEQKRELIGKFKTLLCIDALLDKKWFSLAHLYFQEIIRLVKDKIVSELDRDKLLIAASALKSKGYLIDRQGLEFLKFLESGRPLSEIQFAFFSSP